MKGRPASARRGQPILALCVVLMVWTVTRAAIWNPIFAEGSGEPQRRQLVATEPATIARQDIASERPVVPVPIAERHGPVRRGVIAQPSARAGASDLWAVSSSNHAVSEGQAGLSSARDLQVDSDLPAKHQQRPRLDAPSRVLGGAQTGKRWSFDQWLLMRGASGAVATAPGAASYGGSQAGAIARYRLGRGEQHDSFAYVRTSLAINAPGRDKELALGFGVRPLRRLPLRVLAEARVYDSSSGPVRLRPVVTVVTELPWQNLAGGFRAEAYGQAGYAGGLGPTAFFDAQAVVDHSIAKATRLRRDVRIGAGIWAGGQKGAVRFDAGPRVSMPLDMGDGMSARIALDWRLRVAGNANPASGPALTIASSF